MDVTEELIRRRPPPEPGVIRRLTQDPDVLEQFYRAYVDEVIAFHARRTDSPHDVADLVADTFVAAIASAASFAPA